MMNNLASVIIVTYNHEKYVESCIDSVLDQQIPHEIIIVDNCSTDKTVEIIERKYPNIKVIKNTHNMGYGKSNNVGVKYAKGNYIVILNPDTIVEKNWLSNLLIPIQENEHIITTPKILIYDGSKINTCGNMIHFTGLTFTNGLGENPENFNEKSYLNGISGACFAIRKSDYENIGGFDEDFFLYYEDTDFSWRCHLNGYRILFIPDSIVYHDYRLKLSPEKIYYVEYGRYMIIKKYLSISELVILSPSFLLVEIMTSYYSMKYGGGGIINKIKANYNGILVQKLKVHGDKQELLKNLNITIPTDQLSTSKLEMTIKKFANLLFRINYSLRLS